MSPDASEILLTFERIVHENPDDMLEDLIEWTAAELGIDTLEVMEVVMDASEFEPGDRAFTPGENL